MAPRTAHADRKATAVAVEGGSSVAPLDEESAIFPTGYRVTGVLREGERVVIYRAVRQRDDARVLLKAPRNERPTERDIAQLDHELAVLTRLAGAPVTNPLAMEHAGGRPWLVLEDLGGESLNRIAAGFRAPARAISMGARIASALAEVHRRGVVHRDLKPHHVIVLDDGQARLTDFRSASLTRVDSAGTTQGSLAYMAPEQTGRMSRPVDKRADLYSLGVTLYELLTGRLPFEGSDALEWVHAHIAKTPLPPSELDARIPASVDAVVLKLLSKRAEDRYHGATGLQRDLERCASALERGERAAFQLGADDVPDEFRVAHRLYGREVEVAQLLAGFDRARSSGSCAVSLVGGYSGVGKSALVGELYQPIVRERGCFVSGKFDQYKRDIPYATIVQACRDLLRGLLTLDTDPLSDWRDRLRAALGVNGRLIVDVVPELELIVGPQPAVVELGLHEGQNRFELVFTSFLRVFARTDHPLVLFLDDMQWADGATLGLLRVLARPGQVPDLHLVLAFRDNEVRATHPFQLAVNAMRASGAVVDDLRVVDLAPKQVLQLVADSVSRPPVEAASLAAVVGARAGGNPFFIGELLQMLHVRGLLAFDLDSRGWTWDEAAIQSIEVTDNVVDLLIDRIRGLPSDTRRALSVASCFGSRFDIGTLASVLDVPFESVEKRFEPALADSFVVALDDSVGRSRTLRFQHDRIQQAAYSLVVEERAGIHLRIGRVLRDRFLGGADGVLFDAVKHLDLASPLVTDPAERQELVELNLMAGRRAKSAIAWEPARVYLKSAESLLANDAWDTSYATTFAVFGELAECEFLAGQFAAAEAKFDDLRQRAKSRAARGDIANAQVRLYIVMGRYDDALRLGLAELELFGEPLVTAAGDPAAAIVAERQRLSTNLTGVALGSIVDRPVITDPEPRALIVLLTSMAPAMYSRRPALFSVLAMRTVNLSLEHGNCEHSCFGYSIYAMVLASVEGDPERALAMSEMSIALNERFRDPKLRGTVLHIHANHIVFWRRTFAEASALQEQAYLAAIEVGDLTIAAYVSFMGGWLCLARGQALSTTERGLTAFERLAHGSQHAAAELAIRLQRQFVRALGGLTNSPVALSDEHFDSNEARSRMAEAGFETGLVMHDLLCAMLAWHHGDYPGAEKWLAHGSPSLPSASALPLETTWALFDALTAAALFDTAPLSARAGLVERVGQAEVRLRAWARGCAANFGAEHALVAGELARAQGRTLEALCAYENAADAAREAGLLHLETIAARLAGKLARSSGFARAARSWLKDGHEATSQWEAIALLKRSSASTAEPGPHVTRSAAGERPISEHPEQLDVLAAIKASQSLSRETTVEGLTQTLLGVVLEHTGAQRVVVLLRQRGLLLPVGAASIEGDAGYELPESMARYVERTCTSVVLADASADPTFGADAYFARAAGRSVLCLPILVGSRLLGLLYLENNLVTGAFSPKRLALLEVVSSQLAISLENAALSEERRARAEEVVRQDAIAATAALERGRLAALFEQAPAGIAMLSGPDHVFTLANAGYQAMTGQRALLGLPIRQALPEVAGQGYFELLDHVFHTGEAVHARDALVKLARGAHGATEDAFVDFVYQAIRNAETDVEGIMVLAFEVTDRVRALRALEDSEQRLRLAIEASAIGSWEMDLDGGAILCDGRFDEIFGNESSPAGWSYSELLERVVHADRPALDASFRSAIATSDTWTAECEIVRADGRVGWIEVRGQLRKGGEDRAKRMFGTVVDITSRRAAEAERQLLVQQADAARREAEAANRSKDEFLAMLGHELRNPLAPIVTALHILRLREGERNEKERSIIERQVTHLVRLVDDLLDVSRIASGKIELRREPIELAEVVAKAIEQASPLLEQRRHKLSVAVPRHGLATLGDLTRLAQVVSNLLANAAKYTEPGGHIAVVAERDGENIELRVRDTGIGIAPAMLGRVFDLFAQEAQALSRSQGGLGLGLAIVRSLVGLHGGSVAARSGGIGTGTEFTIRLPALELPLSPSLVPALPTAEPARIDGARVLVVDDNEDAAEVLAETLKHWGYTVSVAHDGPAALRLASELIPAVALLDIGLPVMDGYELARLLKHVPGLERTHLVALTGYGQETDRQRSAGAGFDVHLVKPVDMASLQTMLSVWARKEP